MSTKSKRATIYFDPALHKALRLKSAEAEQSMSDLVNEAVRMLLAEDAEDLAAIEARKEEPAVSFEDFVRELKDRGKL
jgi:hypothetical protein